MAQIPLNEFDDGALASIAQAYQKAVGGRASEMLRQGDAKKIRDILLQNGCEWRTYGSDISPRGKLMMKMGDDKIIHYSFVPDFEKSNQTLKKKAEEASARFENELKTPRCG